MLGANHLLCVFGVGFQLYSQLKKSPHDGTGVLGVRKANSEPELSQLLFISVRQRELIRVLAVLS